MSEGLPIPKRLLNRLMFEAGAWPYDLITQQRVWKRHCAQLLAPIGPGQDRRILDLGCGPAMSAIAYCEEFPRDAVVGLDLSAAMIRRARRNAREARVSLPLIRGSALELPIRSGAIDVATGHSFLYLLPDRRQALREIRRVLKPGGRLVLMEPVERAKLSNAFNEGFELRFITSMLLWRVASRTAGRFSAESLAALLGEMGFEHVVVTPTLHGMGLRAEGFVS